MDRPSSTETLCLHLTPAENGIDGDVTGKWGDVFEWATRVEPESTDASAEIEEIGV